MRPDSLGTLEIAFLIMGMAIITVLTRSFLDWKLPNIWGGIAAFGVYFWTRKMLPTLLVGMAVFSLVRHWL